MEVHRLSIDIQASYLGVKMESTPGKGVKRKLYETDFEDDFPDWQQSLILEMSLEKLQAAQEPLKKYKPCIKDTVSVEHPLRRTVLLENTIKRIKMYMPEDVYNATEMRTFNTFISHSSQYPGIGTFISPMTPVPVRVEEDCEGDCERNDCSELESSLTELLPCRPLTDNKDSALSQNPSLSFCQTGQTSPKYSYSTLPSTSLIPSSSVCSSRATHSADGMTAATSSVEMPFDTWSHDSEMMSTDHHANPSVGVLNDAGDMDNVTFQRPCDDSTTPSSFEGSGLTEAELTEILKYLQEAFDLDTDTEQNSAQLPPRRPS